MAKKIHTITNGPYETISGATFLQLNELKNLSQVTTSALFTLIGERELLIDHNELVDYSGLNLQYWMDDSGRLHLKINPKH